MNPPSTLVTLLRTRAEAPDDGSGYTYLKGGTEVAGELGWGELDRRARSVAAHLQDRVGRGDRALVVYPPGLEFLAAFFGCLYAGVVAVPTMLPGKRSGRERLVGIAKDAAPELLLTQHSVLSGPTAPAEALAETGLPVLATDGLPEAATAWRAPSIRTDDPAFLQYTSGSTRDPRGVVVTHANLLHNQAMMRDVFTRHDRVVVVGWLPFHHDMGLVGTILHPLYVGARCILMPPASVLQQPRRWLEAMTRYRGTTSGGPNFIFDLCVRRIPAEERSGLDLSSWRVAYNGSEPVRPDTMDRFAEAFSGCGFRRNAFHPCYGLAESTLMVTSTGPGGRSIRVERAALEAGRAVLAGDDDSDAQPLASSGSVRGGQSVAVVDPKTREEVPPQRVGEIWVAGESVASGYWNGQPGVFGQSLAAGGQAHWLRTGDLGFFHDGELFVTGRRKDLIIIRGRNLYPQDLEHTAEQSHAALAPGGGAAFARSGPAGEELVLTLELSRSGMRADPAEVAAAVRRRLVEEHAADAAEVVLLAPGGLPRTTSGKVRRAATARALGRGALPVRAREAGPEAPAATAAPARVPPLSAAELDALPPADRPTVLADWLRHLVAGLVSRPADALDVDRPLTALGLDSLAAMQLEGAVEAQLHRSVALADLLGDLTLEQLAQSLATMPSVAPPSPQPPEDWSEDALPLSPGQRSLWFLHRLEPESAAYHVGVAADLDSDLDLDAFRGAWTDLCARHDVLRSVIEEREGEPVRRVLRQTDAPLTLHDASGWADDRRQDAMSDALRAPFALDRDLPLRIDLFRQPGGAYRAVLVVHHIAVDFWSLVVMATELGELYSARRQGRRARLPAAVDDGYARWVHRQESRLAANGDRWWHRWQERLGTAPEELSLPADGARTGAVMDAVSIPFTVPAPVHRRLRTLAEENGCTMYAVLLAAFAALWQRTGGQNEVLVGTPTAGRRNPADREIVGYLSNLVPLRVNLAGEPTFADLLSQVREVLTEALELQEYPFPLLVERLRPRRAPGRHPLVQAVLALEQPHRLEHHDLSGFVLGEKGSRIALGDLVLHSAELPVPGVPFDVTVMLVQAGDTLRGSWRCRADLFSDDTARLLARRFTTLLTAAAEAPQAPVFRLPLWDPQERQTVLHAWNGTASPYPSAATIHDLFLEETLRRPHAPAVVAGDIRWTYAELEKRSHRLAGRLQVAGAGQETRVGVMLSRGPQVPVALLGVLRAGGTYVPLDPEDPPERVRRLARDAGVRMVVADADSEAAAAQTGAPTILIEEAVAGPVSFRPVPVSPDHLAYLMYTSGSTGTPKGVMVPHRAVVRLVRDNDYAEFGPGETVLHAAPLSFDASTFEIWGALLNGGVLAVYQGNPLSLSELGGAIAAHQVTTLWLTAGLFHLMVEERLPDLTPLSQLLAGGDVLRPDLVERARLAHPGLRLINGYGPTEATTFTCCHSVDGDRAGAARIPIGRPLANTRVYVVDDHGDPVPVGVPGELLVGGDGLARGYDGDAASTARRFVPDPFSGTAGARLYRTGDLVCWRPDGRLDFRGRLDDQLKVRGFRVEPGEIEVALSAHQGVTGAVVTARADGTGKRLVAYYTTDAPSPPESSALHAFLAARLPAHLVPSQFVALDAFPLNPRGKVDRAALPQPADALATASQVSSGADPLLEQVAAVWSEVLGVAAVDVDRNLFELGAHSLAVARAHARLSEILGREIPIVDLFTHPTIRAFASHLAVPVADGARHEGEVRAAARHAARRRRRRTAGSTGGSS